MLSWTADVEEKQQRRVKLVIVALVLRVANQRRHDEEEEAIMVYYLLWCVYYITSESVLLLLWRWSYYKNVLLLWTEEGFFYQVKDANSHRSLLLGRLIARVLAGYSSLLASTSLLYYSTWYLVRSKKISEPKAKRSAVWTRAWFNSS